MSERSFDKEQELQTQDYKTLAQQLGRPRMEDYEGVDANDGTVGQLQLEIAFDERLREIATIKDADELDGQHVTKKDLKRFGLIRTALVLIYFVIVPFLQSPGWCNEYYHQQGQRDFGAMDCDAVSQITGNRYSDFPTLSPLITILIDTVCLIGFVIMACYERTWRKQSNSEKKATGLLFALIAISAVDYVRCFLTLGFPYFANMARVGIILSFARTLRSSFKSLIKDLIDSFAILMTIFTYILIFSLTVFYFYKPTAEGILNFATIRDAYRNMTILFTTANYPDIFLMGMDVNYFNCLLFMFFMLIGLYFLTNLLIANVFNKYQQRLQNKRQKRKLDRIHYVEIIFNKHDRNHNGFLEHREAKAFLADMFDFDYNNEYHRDTATKIIEILQDEQRDVLPNHHAINRHDSSHVSNTNTRIHLKAVLQFFALPNFTDIADLENINSLQTLAGQSGHEPAYAEEFPIEPREKGFFDGWIQVVLILLNVLVTVVFILNDQFKSDKRVRSGFWRMLSVPFTAIFFVEAAMGIFSSDGATIFREKKLLILEVICQVVSIWAYIQMYTDGTEMQYATGASMLSFAFLLRNLRISVLLQERREFKVITEMIMKMTVPFFYMLACLYIVYYIFAIIGMYGLGGVIQQPHFHSEGGIPNNLYYLVNFNDLGMSMNTLYAFMIINNWPAITDMMVNASGSVWPRIYFMAFYILVQWILLNIVIAMMLDIFTNVETQLDAEEKRIGTVHKLMKLQKQMGAQRFERYCDEVNESILRDEVDKSNLKKRFVEQQARNQIEKQAKREQRLHQ